MLHSVTQFDIWKNLPPQVLAEIQGLMKEQTLVRGEFLYRATEDAKYLYFVKSGLVGLVMIGINGHEHLLRLFKPGQFFGHRALFSKEKYHASAVALEETKIIKLDRDIICQLIRQHWEISFAVIEALAKELRLAEEKLVSRSEKDVSARIAETIIFLKDRHPEHQWTRKEIADYCGSTTPTVIKTLARFEAEGLIAQKGRQIQILQRQGLLALSTPVMR